MFRPHRTVQNHKFKTYMHDILCNLHSADSGISAMVRELSNVLLAIHCMSALAVLTVTQNLTESYMVSYISSLSIQATGKK